MFRLKANKTSLYKLVGTYEELPPMYSYFPTSGGFCLLYGFTGAVQRADPGALREYVEKIIVHALDKSSGHRVQHIGVHYNFIGEIDFSPEFSRYSKNNRMTPLYHAVAAQQR